MTSERLQPVNRALVLTPPGAAAIAVVRLIGPAARPLLKAHFSNTPRVNRCVHGLLHDGDRVIDDPVVVLRGDGSADINLHGGPWIVQAALGLAAKFGFRAIEWNPDDPPLEGVDGTTILEREVAAHLPRARTELAAKALLAQPAAWKAFLASSPSPDAIARVLADKSLHHLLSPPSVAIVGAPNVGKSTLANQLFGQERSITADIPGTTRDWVREMADINGLAVMLLDTPGQRQTADPIESAAIAASQSRIVSADLIVLVLSAARPLAPEQAALLKAHPTALRVVNQVDRPWAWDLSSPQSPSIQTIATRGDGIAMLRQSIAAHFGCANFDVQIPRIWTKRQRMPLEIGELTDITWAGKLDGDPVGGADMDEQEHPAV